MRYLKGSVELGETDRKLLEVVANTNKITQPQLFDISILKDIEPRRRHFDRRIRRLTKGGFLKREECSSLGSRRLYSITNNGICGLEEGGIHPLSVYVDRNNGVEHQTRHALQLNRAHIALLKIDAQLQWTRAKDIHAINRSGYQTYAKTYDAIVDIMVDDRYYKIGIEYERTLKASERYGELLAKLEAESRLNMILYLFSDPTIGAALDWAFRNARKEIVLAQLEEFVTSPLDSPATRRCLSTTLRHSLRRINTQR
jgi:hypothetical protein